MPKGWFGPKIVGYGIGPRSWEGWLATALFAASLYGLLKFAAPDLSPLFGLSPAVSKLVLGGIWLGLYLALVGATYYPEA